MAKKIAKNKLKLSSFSYSSFFSARLSSIIAIILLLASVGFLYAKNQELERRYTEQKQNEEERSATPKPTSVPTAAPAVKKADTDPIVTCNIHADCGGGSRQMKLSKCNQMICCSINERCGGGARFMTKTECDNLYCCFLNDGTAKLMTKNGCDNYSTNNQQNNKPAYTNPPSNPQGNKVPVFLTYSKFTIYCPSQNADAVKSIDATMTSKSQEWAKQFNDCLELQKSIEPCYKDCYSKEGSASWSCIQSYQTTTPEYKSCQDKVTNDFLNCTSGCPNPYTTCEYVYGERKSMSDQINNLCK